MINQHFRLPPFFRSHAPVSGCCGSSGDGCASTQGFFGLRRQRSKTHSGNCDGNFQAQWIFCKSSSQNHISSTVFTITFERITRHGCSKKQQIIESRQWSFCTSATNIINSGSCCSADFRQGIIVKSCRFSRMSLCSEFCHFKLVGISIINIKIIQFAGRTVTAKIGGIGF